MLLHVEAILTVILATNSALKIFLTMPKENLQADKSPAVFVLE